MTGDRREVHRETAFGIGCHRLGETVVVIAGIDLHRLAAGIGGDQLTIYMDRFARYIHRFIGLQRCRKRRDRVYGQEIRAVVRIIQLLYMPVLVHYGMEVIVTGFLGQSEGAVEHRLLFGLEVLRGLQSGKRQVLSGYIHLDECTCR